MRHVGRSALRPVPAATAFGAIDRMAPGLARLARWTGLPPNVANFPDRVRSVLGDLDRGANTRLLAARVRFLGVRAYLDQFLAARESIEERSALGPIAIDGAEHVARAVADGRGVILATAHFGLPPLLKLGLEARGQPVIGVGGLRATRVDVVVGRDVWLAARGVQQMRAALVGGKVCIVLVDMPRGRFTEHAFLGGRIPIAPGAFRLAQVTKAALLPSFGLCEPALGVEIGAPVEVPAGDSELAAAIAEFLRRYDAVARRHPSHLFGYDPVFGARPGASRESGASGPPSRTAPR